MPRQKRKSKLRPKTPSRVKKRTKKAAGPRSLQHPELWGLGLVALGLFLGSVIYAGWNGGYVGGALADGLDALIGGASWVVPVAFVARRRADGRRGARSSTCARSAPASPSLSFGLMVTLGSDQGGYLGQVLGGAVGVAIGATGSTILGVLLLLVGALLLSGASLGAILRRSATSCTATSRARRRRSAAAPAETWDEPARGRPRPKKPLVDAEAAYPDVVEPARLAPVAAPDDGARAARHPAGAALRRHHASSIRSTSFRTATSCASRPRRRTSRGRRRRASPTCSCRRSRTSASTRP